MSNKLKTIILSIVCALVTIGLIITIFFLVEINKKLSIPTNLMVVDNLPDGEILLQVDNNPKAEKYVFVIYRDEEKVAELVSDYNYIDASKNFENAGAYTIKARAVGKTNASMSDYTEKVDFIVRKKLSTPTIQLDIEKNRFLFSTVTGATSYELFYGVEEDGTIGILNNDHVKYFGELGKRYFDLSSLPKGNYTLRLLAKGGAYMESDFTDPVYYTKKDKLNKPDNILFDNIDKILTFNSAWHTFQVIAYYENSDITKTIKLESNEENYNFELSEYLTDDVSKLEIIALGNDEEFTTNSDIAIWQNE